MNDLNFQLVAALIVVSLFTGCAPKPVTGGTSGQLLAAGKPLADVQLTLHQFDGTQQQPVGFGVTHGDGSFSLVTNEARGPLVLAAGEYRCTLESVGAPVRIPPAYKQADTSPLKVNWSPDQGLLHIDVPVALLP